MANVISIASLLIAFGTLIYAALSVRQARLAAQGALRSARAAEEQVTVSRDQVHASADSARQASEAADTTLLQIDRQRVYEQAPKPVIALDSRLDGPVRVPDNQEPPEDLQRLERVLAPVDYWETSARDIGYAVCGTLINEGTESMRVETLGVVFWEGPTSLAGTKQAIPATTQNDVYLIRPGQMCCFIWWAAGQIDDWVALYRHDHDPERTDAALMKLPEKERMAVIELAESNRHAYLGRIGGTIFCRPATQDHPCTRVTLRLYSLPLTPFDSNSNDWRKWNFHEVERPRIFVDWERSYADDPKAVVADLTGNVYDGVTMWPKPKRP
jgi:hypothetical protein